MRLLRCSTQRIGSTIRLALRSSIRPLSCLFALSFLCVTIAACAAQSSNRVVLTFERAGGFARLEEKLEIAADLSAVYTSGDQARTLQIDLEAFADLEAALQEADFRSLPRNSVPKDACCDLMEYTLTYQGHTVHTADTFVPEALAPAFDILATLLASG